MAVNNNSNTGFEKEMREAADIMRGNGELSGLFAKNRTGAGNPEQIGGAGFEF